MFKFSLLLSLVLLLFGCSTAPEVKVSQIEVKVEKPKIEFISVDKNLLNKCNKPKLLTESIPGLKEGKVSEKDLINAFSVSYANEVNCYIVKQHVMKVQEKMQLEINKANEND